MVSETKGNRIMEQEGIGMSLGTQEQRTKGMKRQAQELIEQAYQRGFKAGQVDNQTFHESI